MKKIKGRLIGLILISILLVACTSEKGDSNSNSDSTFVEEGKVEQIVIPENEIQYSYEHEDEDEDVVISVGDSAEMVEDILGAPEYRGEPDENGDGEYWLYSLYSKAFGVTNGKVSSIRIMSE